MEKNLSEIEELVDDALFFRVNRRIILHIDAIKEYKIIEFSKISIRLISPEWVKEEIQISQFTSPDFKQWISSL